MTANKVAKGSRFDRDGLTIREALFARHYIANGGNATQAAASAGYLGDCNVRAVSLMSRPKIVRVIQRNAQKTLTELDARKERVLRELVCCAFVDPRQFFQADGSLKPIRELDACTAASISSFEFRAGQLTKLRFASKTAALELLANYLGMLDGGGKDGQIDRLHEVVNALQGDQP